MNKSVLLLGNGINNVGKKYSWEELIQDLIRFVGLGNLDEKNKPFPLFYEELYLSNLKSNKLDEPKLKEFISENIKKIEPNDVHQKITSMSFSDIITTNYDYTIENSLMFTGSELNNNGVIKESVYSVFRHTQVNGTKIWHVHGEINLPKTILLGFEHYSGQLQQIRTYVVSGTGKSYKIQFPALMTQIKKGNVVNNSWLDLIFTQNIHIIGLTLDFVESDLWWLITYRARKKLEKASKKNRVNIRNNIIYYYPVKYESLIKQKLEILSANEVTTFPIDDDPDKKSYYFSILDRIQDIG